MRGVTWEGVGGVMNKTGGCPKLWNARSTNGFQDTRSILKNRREKKKEIKKTAFCLAVYIDGFV